MFGFFSVACGDNKPERNEIVQQDLTADQAAVLGFERPTIDWSTQNGSAITESATVTQGTKALALQPLGWTEITSAALSSLGPVKSTLSVDVLVPAQIGWGDLHVVLVAPSLGWWWNDLGTRSLAQLPAGEYATLTFPLPAGAETALEGNNYSDLRVKVVINAPSAGAPYLLDHIDLADAGTPAPPTGGGGDVLSLVTPQGQSRSTMLLSASNDLQVDDRVEVGDAGSSVNVAGLGASGTRFGSAVLGHNNIYSVGNVLLRSQARVEGFVRTEGRIDEQDATVRILGQKQPGFDVPTQTFSWTVKFPSSATPLDTIQPGASVSLAPGAYQSLNQNGGHLFLRTGTYYFANGFFNSEPAATIHLDNFRGPIVIYVKGGFTYKGKFSEDVARKGQVLVGYFGTSLAFLQAPFVGTMVAPNAKIELQRPTSGMHEGSFFAKDIQVFSDSHIRFLPFDWSTLDLDPTRRPDTDGDGTDDLNDPCPIDPNKVLPGICGCNRSDVDADQDGVPDCADVCPVDPNNTIPGTCGCVGQPSLRPVGTPCVVEACSGSRQQATCDGQGQCGTPSCDPIGGGNCTPKIFKDRLYWLCSGPVSWEVAEGLCAAEPGRALVRVDDRIEDQWLSTIFPTEAWMGGNAKTAEDQWFWSANGKRDFQMFWQNGLPVKGRYANWQQGSPSGGTCMSMQVAGKWADVDCTTEQGFICEQPLRQLPPHIGRICPCDFFPNLSCDSCGDEPPPGPCVEGEVAFSDEAGNALDYDQVADIGVKCRDNCPEEGAAGCAEFCKGFASVPPPGTCATFSEDARAGCELETIHPTATCSIETPACPAGYTCGRHYQCAELDANQEPVRCTSNGECASGVCLPLGVCLHPDPNQKSACDTKVGDECVGKCFGSFRCGIPEAKCAANEDPNDIALSRCNVTEICAEPGSVGEERNPVFNSESNLEEEPFPADTIFNPEPAEPDPYPLAKPDGCGGPGEPACDFPIGEHPWCKFRVSQDDLPAGPTVSDADNFGDKQGTGGGNGPIRFDFDPNLSISYGVDSALPFGDAMFRASALASATAQAHFQLLGVGGDVNIVDARASLDVGRCGLDADAHLKLFGHDFLPDLLGADLTQDLKDINTPQAQRDACEGAIEKFQATVDRAQKALRDAQELIRQQKELVAKGERFSPDLCEKILGDQSKGLPVDFPSGVPFTGCGNLSPEDTINLFVRYYKNQALSLVAAQASLIQEGLPEIPSATIPFGDAGGQETQQIVNVSFAIGPIPMNLTIEAFVKYGVTGSLVLALTPQNLPSAVLGGTREDLAKVDATVTPFAGAGVSIFLGVGFDFGALSVKVGIDGSVVLGDVYLPIYGGAGIAIQPEIEDPSQRPLPPDLAGMVASANLLFPPGLPKKFRFDAFYKFGANVDIQNILSGTISAKARVKFFWFSKTWKKTVVTFGSPLDPIVRNLVGDGAGGPFADGFGALGPTEMPTPLVDLAELETPAPLPPLGEGGTGGTGGTGGASGSGGAGTGGAGARPPVSLQVLGDPRYKDFDASRVDELFYDGYCDCAPANVDCRSDRDCCDSNFCVFDDSTHSSTCESCVDKTTVDLTNVFNVSIEGPHCKQNSECCQTPGGPENLCYPFIAGAQTYCQACRARNEPAFDANDDRVADFGECCEDLPVFRPPNDAGVARAGTPICSGCRNERESCNVTEDCCSSQATCHNHTCVVVK
jgi:hypothetical protein